MACNILKSSTDVVRILRNRFQNVLTVSSLNVRRDLYAKATLGLDTFELQKQNVQKQMVNIAEKFREKMMSYCKEDSTSMIFTEDLKNMIHLAENDEDIDLVITMAKKFNSQNKQLRFGTYVFGPVIMRLFYLYNKTDLAFECFKSPDFTGMFDQLISYQILMDLQYENGKYNEMLETFQLIKERQIEGARYPKNIIVLTMAACYKLNSHESLQFALKLWRELGDVGHFPMRRAATFCAGLALNQGVPEAALEIISTTKNQNYTTVRNIKAVALAELGRIEDVIPILKSVMLDDRPSNVPHTFNRDVLNRIREVVLKSDNIDIRNEFEHLEKLFEKQGHVSDVTLDQQLCQEIQKPPVMNNREFVQSSRNNPLMPPRRPLERRTFKLRPGLNDIV